MTFDTFPSLPPELESPIIDLLRDDKASMSACSLVCFRWLAVSRTHLFHTVTIYHSPPTHRRAGTLTKFLQCLTNSESPSRPPPAIGTYVRKLTMNGGAHSSRVTLRFLRALMDKLPQLRSLSLESSHIINDLPVVPVERPTRRLDELTLFCCSAPGGNPRHFLALLCMFSDIRSLRIGGHMGLLISAPTLPRLSAVFKPPLIQSLDIDSVDMPSASVIYEFFADTAWTDRQEITHMRLTIHNLEDSGVFSNFVHRTGATFRTLYLRINLNMDILEPETPSVVSDPFSLAPCAALESLVLCFCCITESVHDQVDVVLFMLLIYTGLFSEHRGELSALTHVRMDAGSDRVEVARAFIALAQDCDHGEDGEQNAHEGPGMQGDSELWTDFEDALLGLPALERVEFGFDEILCGDRDAGAIKVALESALEKRLPRLQQQGTVRVLI